jgi:thiol-disulfide isomerase/thioredoxin
MRTLLVVPALLYVVFSTSCRPAAPPVAVSNTPVSINDRPLPNVPLPLNKEMAQMSWTDQKDRVQKVADLKGKAVVLDFWATWCEPCIREIPHLNSLQAKHGTENLQVVGLNVGGEEDYPEIPKFLKRTKIDYPIAFPTAELAAFVFAEKSDIPQTIVLDRNGKIVERFVGFDDVVQRDLIEAVSKALKSN